MARRLGGQDVTDLYLIALNSHDGTTGFDVCVSAIRPVCHNTVTAAFRGAKSRVSIRHTATARGRVQDAREALDMSFKYAGRFQEAAEDMLATTMTDADFAAYVERLADAPVGKLLAALLRLKELDADDKSFAPAQEEYSWPNEPPIVCGWNDDEDFAQIFDDNYRYCCEGGEEPPWIGCVKFEPSEKSISESMTVIRHTGAVLQALDKALIEVKELSV